MEEESTAYHKSDELWYSDGTVVLRAEDTLFCVYSGILSQHSVVFMDMFGLPQLDTETTFEGRPMVEIFDKSEHAYHLLKAMHDPQHLEEEILPSPSLALIVLQMATKYVAKYLRSTLLENLLEKSCPSTYTTYRRMVETFPQYSKYSLYIQIANGARGIDAPILLPSALYRCCCILDDLQVLDGVTRKSGEVLSLDAENKRLVLIARTKLGHATRTRAHQFVFFPSRDDLEACASVTECREYTTLWASHIDRDKRTYGPFTQPNWDATASNLCPACSSRWKDSYDRSTQELWNELPSFFSLPPWEELAKQSRWEY